MTGTGVPVGSVVQGLLGAFAELDARTAGLGMRLGRLEISIPFVADDAARYRLELTDLEPSAQTWALRRRVGFGFNEIGASGEGVGSVELVIDLRRASRPEATRHG